MANKVVQIAKRAKKIRKPGEDWQRAMSRARTQIMGSSLSPAKKASKKKAAKKPVPKKKMGGKCKYGC